MPNHKIATVALVACLGIGGACRQSEASSEVAISGGQVVDRDAWSFAVTMDIQGVTGWKTACSGTYIGRRQILTAAHCVRYDSVARANIQTPEDVLAPQKIRIGTRSGQHFPVTRLYVEPFLFNSFSQGLILGTISGYDLAVLEIDQEPGLTPATLAAPYAREDASAIDTEQNITILGFQGSAELKSGTVQAQRYWDPEQTSLMLGDGTVKACPGDSGGGVFQTVPEGTVLTGVLSFQMPLSFIPLVYLGTDCPNKGFTGMVDLRQPGAHGLIARAQQFFEGAEQSLPISLFRNPPSFPGKIEAEHAQSTVDFSVEKKENALQGFMFQGHLDVMAEAGMTGFFVGQTEIGESLTYLVKSAWEGPANLTVRARNSQNGIAGRLLVRLEDQILDIKLNAEGNEWQQVSVPLTLKKPGHDSLQIGIEILSPLDFDWFSVHPNLSKSD